MFHLQPRPFRDPRRSRHTEIFDLRNAFHLQVYNELLAEDGRSLVVDKVKTWGVSGTPGRSTGDGGWQDAKDDAYYVHVDYHRNHDSPYIPLDQRDKGMITIEVQDLTTPVVEDPLDFVVRLPERTKKNKRRSVKGKKSPGSG